MGKLKKNEGKDDDPMTIQNLMFPKTDDWTMKDAKDWLADHEDVLKEIKCITPTEDYLQERINKVLNKNREAISEDKINELIERVEKKRKGIVQIP